MNFTRHAFYIYWRDYQEGFGSINNESLWSFAQLEPVWFLFNLAGMLLHSSAVFLMFVFKSLLIFIFLEVESFTFSPSLPLYLFEFGKPLLSTVPTFL